MTRYTVDVRCTKNFRVPNTDSACTQASVSSRAGTALSSGEGGGGGYTSLKEFTGGEVYHIQTNFIAALSRSNKNFPLSDQTPNGIR